MKKSQAFPSKYLKSADLDGNDLTLTVDTVEWEEIGKEKKKNPVLYFRGKGKPWICNVTNWDRIVLATGKDDSEDWPGEKITLYVDDNISYGSDIVEGIRVRTPKKAKKSKAENPPTNDNIPF